MSYEEWGESGGVVRDLIAPQCAALARGELPHINADTSNMMAEVGKISATIGHKMNNPWGFDLL